MHRGSGELLLADLWMTSVLFLLSQTIKQRKLYQCKTLQPWVGQGQGQYIPITWPNDIRTWSHDHQMTVMWLYHLINIICNHWFFNQLCTHFTPIHFYAAVIFLVWKLPISHIGDVWNGIVWTSADYNPRLSSWADSHGLSATHFCDVNVQPLWK